MKRCLTFLASALLLSIAVHPAVSGATAVRSPSVSPSPTPTTPPPVPDASTAAWVDRIDELVGNHSMSVTVGLDGTRIYAHAPTAERTPASNEKLLLSIALLHALGPDARLTTRALTGGMSDEGVVDGSLWIVGAGDPEVDKTRLVALAKHLVDAGLTSITGSVRGSTTVFSHDWWAPGWKQSFPRDEVALPTALAYNFNTANGKHIKDPERRAAASLTAALKDLGVSVAGDPSAGEAPTGLTELASVSSAPLIDILHRQNVPSDNYYAETMGKLLGATVEGNPGTIAKGADALDTFAAAHDAADIDPQDGSGLSYDDVVTADDVLHLLWYADSQTWNGELRGALPSPGEGTLSGRLKGLDVHAKTGTLTDISALSGWVRNKATDGWVTFSILSKGMSKTTASHIEDRIVTTLAKSAL